MKLNLKKYVAQIFVGIIAIALVTSQMGTFFLGKEDPTSFLQNNEVKISRMFNGIPAKPTIRKKYYNLTLPIGTTLFAETDSNFKLRYQQNYFDVHILTSTVDAEVYAKENFSNSSAMRYELPPLKGENVFAYVNSVAGNYQHVAIYSKDVEVTFVVPKSEFNHTFLKATEVLRNTVAIVQEDEAIFIGSNKDKKPQTILDEDARNRGDENIIEDDNIEIPVGASGE